jgi:hypothetical protein
VYLLRVNAGLTCGLLQVSRLEFVGDQPGLSAAQPGPILKPVGRAAGDELSRHVKGKI